MIQAVPELSEVLPVPKNQPAIFLRDLHKVFEDPAGLEDHRVLTGVNLAIDPGEFFILLGPSGCGKSTLLNLIAGFFPVTSGTLEVNGKPVRCPGGDRAMVFQNADSALFSWLTVQENVEFGLKMRRIPRAKRREIAARYIDLVGLTGHEKKFPGALSGGMKQRVQLARVLANDPDILLMDEPFGALDAMTRRQMQKEIVRVWKKTEKTVVFVTHDLTEALLLGQRIGVMDAGPDSKISDLHDVGLKYPRDASSAEFNSWQSVISSHFEDGGGI